MSEIYCARDHALTETERLALIDWIDTHADQPGTGDLMTHDQLFHEPLFARVLGEVEALTLKHWPEVAGLKKQSLGVHVRAGNGIRPHNHLASNTRINALYYLNGGSPLCVRENDAVREFTPDPGLIVACPGSFEHWVPPQPPPDDRYSIVVCWVTA